MGEVVRVENLSFSYPNGRRALDSVSLSISQGEFVAVMGPSPSGKSTLVYALSGLIPHCVKGEIKGSVKVDGLDTREHPVAELAKRVGVILQDPEAQLLELRAVDEVALPLENLGVPAEEIRLRVGEALEMVGLRGYEERSPSELSGGEKQRLAIASVLALRPKVIVLDEPTANVDPPGTLQVYETLKRLNEEHGLTVIVVENKVEVARRYAKRAVLMEGGRVVADGEPSKVLRSDVLARLGLDARPARRPAKARAGSRGREVVRFEEVSFRYPDGTLALDHVDLTLREGEVVFLMGRNGSGKSTLVKHMNGLLKPSSGRVLVDGCDTRTCPTYRLSRIVGLVFQNPAHQIVGESVYDEIAMGLRHLGVGGDDVRREVARIARAFELEDKLDMIPEELSVGELKRLMIASIVAMRPKVLVLDEPMTGMTSAHSRRVLDTVLGMLGESSTIVVITHDPRLAFEYATRVVVMSRGRVVQDGSPEVLARCELLSSYLEVVPDVQVWRHNRDPQA
ncbi:ABC transporter ATP-binding protein [Thermofilum pendens]|uniref:ABC transporter related n=1 Tax=Thermofilum pendens (strain DSM 2475 / Hrk 5) TaxID=368408 RepID=A1S0G0_THEPD|nr:ABC transporter ATP-binding protein [Thermofilum pendens]ABL78940.1 ABC transporter related [Thermofilum pendens Hrk 5]